MFPLYMRISVIIPTYNECLNIQNVLLEVEQEVILRDVHNEWHVLVVDGNSPDGTASVVENFSRSRPWLHLLSEPSKRGIACAYVDGIRYSIHTLQADAVVEMDGDGQHDPRVLLTMVEMLDTGIGCVIGSRYMPGGSVPREWGIIQRSLSRFGSLYSQLLLGLPVRDVTSGFKMTRVSGAHVNSLPLDPKLLLTRGYAYKIQFMHSLWRAGALLQEIPIAFRLRNGGSSKSSSIDILESLKVTTILRFSSLV